MKKWVFVFVVLAVIGGIYLLSPRRMHVFKAIGDKCSVAGANRYFTDTSKWIDWWPRDGGDPVRRGASFVYRDYAYTIMAISYNRVRFAVQHMGDSIYDGNMQIVQVSGDSLLAGAGCVVFNGNDPIRRVTAYRRGKRMLENIEGVLGAFKTFTEEQKNIYGISIEHTMSTDSILMTISGNTPEYPTTAYIYELIDSVRHYVNGQGAAVHNPPLLNVARMADGRYRTMVALSVNKQLRGADGIVAKRFVPWKMIEAEVHGGPHMADGAFDKLYKFRDDYHLDIMSIPFQFLETDRRLEPDTAKWVTRVCAPIS